MEPGLPHRNLSHGKPGPHIPLDLVIKAILLKKWGKAAGTSLIVAEMLKASGLEGAHSWSNRRFHPFWENLYLMGGEYHPLPLQEHGRRTWTKTLLRPEIARSGHEGSRMGGWELFITTGANLWHAVWLHAWTQHHKCNIHCMAATRTDFCYQVIVHDVCWYGRGIRSCTQTCHLVGSGVDEWLVQLIQSTYGNARSKVPVGCNLGEEFIVKVDVHQGSWLSFLLIITVLEALSKEFCPGCSWENMYVDNLVIITESLEELLQKLILWKASIKGKELQVIIGKTWYLGQGSMCFRSLANTPAAWVSRASSPIPFSVVFVSVGSTSNAVLSLAVWSLMPASG